MAIGVLLWVVALGDAIAAPSFEITLDRSTIRQGEAAVATLKFYDFRPTGVHPPRMSNVQFHQLSGLGEHLSIINGNRSQYYQLKLQIRPLTIGRISIPSMTAVMNGKNYRSQPLVITVVKGLPAPPVTTLLQKGYFADLVLPKSNVYVGEPFVFYIRVLYGDANVVTPEIKNEGFTFTDSQAERSVKVYNGQRFNEALVPKIALPLKIGRLQLGPVDLAINIVVSRDFFRGVQTRPVNVHIPVSEINVLPVPAKGRPASFSGAVGNYQMDVTASPTNLTAGEPITLNINISGSGALENVQLPSYEGWKDFKVYPPNSSLNYQDRSNSTGSRTFEQVVVPEKADLSRIPEIEFSFFNPEKKTFQTLKHPPIPLTVTPAAKVTASPVIMVTQTNKADAGPKIATELVHIKQHLGSLQAVGGTGHGIWALPAGTFVAWLLLLMRRRGIEKLESDPRLRRRLATDRLVADEIIRLKSLADDGDGPEFFKLLVTLLQERLGERLDLPASAITESVVEEKLTPAGVADDLVARLERLFDACNQARYAPDMAKGELQKLAADAEIALGALKEVEL